MLNTRTMCASTSTTIALAPQWWNARSSAPLETFRWIYWMLS